MPARLVGEQQSQQQTPLDRDVAQHSLYWYLPSLLVSAQTLQHQDLKWRSMNWSHYTQHLLMPLKDLATSENYTNLDTPRMQKSECILRCRTHVIISQSYTFDSQDIQCLL